MWILFEKEESRENTLWDKECLSKTFYWIGSKMDIYKLLNTQMQVEGSQVQELLESLEKLDLRWRTKLVIETNPSMGSR